MQSENLDAGIVIIGNEILSGKTQDINVKFIATELADLGIRLKEVRVVADVEEDIIVAINALRTKYTYVFTTGGIGPTHDDITSQTIAKAFANEFVLHEKAKQMMEEYATKHNKTLKPEHYRMCYMPKNAVPLLNRETGAPGFKLENVFVMAGVPSIMQAMFCEAKKHLKIGSPIVSRSIETTLPESLIAEDFSALQDKYPNIEMGSYPHCREGKWSTTLSLRGNNLQNIEKAMQELELILKRLYN
jgi:molybdenum cofactor synthesis domain-containing protein